MKPEFTFEEMSALMALTGISQITADDMRAADAIQMMYLVNNHEDYREEFLDASFDAAVEGLAIAQQALNKFQLIMSEEEIPSAKH